MPQPDVVDSVSAENVRAYVEYVCAQIPSRLAGSENGARIAHYNADALRAVGVAAQVRELQALVSFPRSCTLAVLSPRIESIAAFTSGHSPQTPREGVSGEVVYVGPGGERDYAGKDVVGKIILCEMSYSPARMEKQRIAAIHGAIGAIMMNWGSDADEALPFGSIKPAWGNPTPETMRDEMPRMPCVGVSRKSGIHLKAMSVEGRLRTRIDTDVDNEWRTVQITTGAIDASASKDFVIVGGHQDSWFGAAATDNAAGNACMIELARVFAARRDQLRRGISFGFWAAHETGTMAGSAWYADQEWDRLREHAIAYLLIDQPACAGTTRWLTASNLEMREFHQAIERRHLVVPCDWRPQKKGGDASFFGLGVPMLYGMGAFTQAELHATADANMGWWHHSLDCTVDKVDFTWMQAHLQVYAGWLWELCTAPILPFDFTAVAQQFAVRLEELQANPKLQPLNLEPLVERARSLGRAALRLAAEVRRQRSNFQESNADAQHAAALLNACLKRLSNTLIPIQSTVKGVYGHDSYGLTAQLSPIPCLYDTHLLAELEEGSEEWLTLETHLHRQRNRVSDALAEASSTINDTLSRTSD